MSVKISKFLFTALHSRVFGKVRELERLDMPLLWSRKWGWVYFLLFRWYCMMKCKLTVAHILCQLYYFWLFLGFVLKVAVKHLSSIASVGLLTAQSIQGWLLLPSYIPSTINTSSYSVIVVCESTCTLSLPVVCKLICVLVLVRFLPSMIHSHSCYSLKKYNIYEYIQNDIDIWDAVT